MKIAEGNIKYVSLLLVFFIGSCGEAHDTNRNTTELATHFNPNVAKISIKPATALLAGVKDSMQLSAKTYDRQGIEIASDLIWSSSRPEIVKVDQTGRIEAVAIGSSQIIAQTENVKSPPVIVAVSVPAQGVVMINDDQILSAPKPVGATSEFSTGLQYQVLVKDIDLLAPGTLVSGNGEKPLAGEVVAATRSGSNVLLTLKVVPVSDLFPHLSINETIKLNTLESEIPDEVNEHFNVTTSPDGTMTLTPKSGDSVKFERSDTKQ